MFVFTLLNFLLSTVKPVNFKTSLTTERESDWKEFSWKWDTKVYSQNCLINAGRKTLEFS